MHTEPKPPHGSAEWLAVRHRDPQGRPRLTASVAAALFGEHEFLAPAELATQMLSETPPESAWSEEIERGHEWEPTIIQSWHKRNPGRLVADCEPVMHCHGRWVANLDALVWESTGPGTFYACPLEIKTAKGYVPEIKPYWRWQGVAQRWCLNGTPGRVEWAWVDSDFVFKQATQWVTQDDLDRLVAAGEDWLSYIDLDLAPPSVVLSAQQVAQLHPRPEEEPCELPGETLQWISRLRTARAAKKDAELLEEQAKEYLAPLLAKRAIGRVNGVDVISWKASKDREGFDTAKFRAEHPDLWQQYQKTSPGARTMRVLKGFDEGVDQSDDNDEF